MKFFSFTLFFILLTSPIAWSDEEKGRAEGMILQKEKTHIAEEVLKLEREAKEGNDYQRKFAQYNLGLMYMRGFGVLKDGAKAVEWFQKSAAVGFSPAQERLGFMYMGEPGVPKNYAKALEWFQKSSEQGNATAHLNVAGIYEDGRGVPKNLTKAFEFYQKAAAQGIAYAQYKLGLMYGNGIGVSQDKTLAYAWLNLACANTSYPEPFELAQSKRNEIESILTNEEIEEGQQLSTNWRQGEIMSSPIRRSGRQTKR